jgi:hypothetical protein
MKATLRPRKGSISMCCSSAPLLRADQITADSTETLLLLLLLLPQTLSSYRHLLQTLTGRMGVPEKRARVQQELKFDHWTGNEEYFSERN